MIQKTNMNSKKEKILFATNQSHYSLFLHAAQKNSFMQGIDNYSFAFIPERHNIVRQSIEISPACIVINAKDSLSTIKSLKQNSITTSIPIIGILDQDKNNSYDIDQLILAGLDDFIITNHQEIEIYQKNLLTRISMAIERSKRDINLNPLTKLPGNILIHKALQKKTATIFYIDIDNFKAYNDQHGFIAGDKIIQKTAAVLSSFVKGWTNLTTFLGHIGGDDFIMIISNNQTINPETLISTIKKRYSEQLPNLSISIVEIKSDKRLNPQQIAQQATIMMKKVKQKTYYKA